RIISFAVNGVEPDLCIVLDAPVPVLKERAHQRGQGERFDNLDEAFLERVRAGYLWEAKQRGLPVVFATEDFATVADKIWKQVTSVIAVREPSQALAASREPVSIQQVIADKQATLSADGSVKAEPAASNQADEIAYVSKNDKGVYEMTEAGREYLETAVTDVAGNVYGFTDKLSPVTIAAAMARLSRRGDDMRVTILDEFAGKLGKDEKLLQRVITAYGDDSVQQLAGMHVVVENASNLLTKKLEWGRLAAYLEQSTRYIYYDQKDAEGKYKYFVPPELSKTLKQKYVKTLDTIFDTYSDMVHKLTRYVQDNSDVPEAERDVAWKGATRAQACDACRPVLPVATKSTVGIFGSGQAIESLIMHLMSDELPEARRTGQLMLGQVRQITPTFFERADKPDRGGAAIAYRANTSKAVAQLADKYLTQQHAEGDAEPVTLNSYWPKSELSLIPDMLYEHSELSLNEIRQQVENWPYERKTDVFTTYMGERLNRRHRPGRALENAHYSFDLLCDYGIFRDLQRHRMVEDLAWQQLTPRYGYDVPELIEKAGLAEQYEECFQLSLQLHSALQKAGYTLEAQYATLLGHKMRWKVSYNAREAFHLHELRTSPQGHSGYRKLVQQMHEKVAEVHPLLAEAMIFVNKGEDEKLTRLAAERYTQYKLAQLDKKA
ncbi:MAG TPA: FAD-dependent thymidylate synthase, partial [Candidatus Saccharimonadales bacterium]|nr:FAD-dependent thymidylate synthase [Candidatus Saccharimonadales bacterium]